MKRTLIVGLGASCLTLSAAFAQTAPHHPPQTMRPPAGWVAESGLAKVMPQTKPITPRELASRAAITELFARWGNSIDEMNAPLMRSILTDDAVMTVYLGSPKAARSMQGGDTVVQGMVGLHQNHGDQRRHALSNVIIQNLTADTAEGFAYGVVARTADGTMSFLGEVYYSGKFRRGKDGLWRISNLDVIIDGSPPQQAKTGG